MKYDRMSSVKQPSTQATGGFTLIEVLVVVIIAAVLAAIAAPGWLAFLNRQRVSAVRSDLVQVMRTTQQRAIQQRQTYRILILEDETAPTVAVRPLGTDLSTAGMATGVPQVLGSVDVGTEYVLEAYTVNSEGIRDASANAVIFDYQGMPRSQTVPAEFEQNLPFIVSIQVAGSSAQQCVIVANLLGTIKTATGDDCNNPPL